LTTVGILLCAGWIPHFRVFVWGYRDLESGMDFIRHIAGCEDSPTGALPPSLRNRQMISLLWFVLFLFRRRSAFRPLLPE
jgi:hypothetical protein